MDRRRFLKVIACLPLFAIRPASPIGSQDVPRFDPKNILLLKANVAGFRYYNGDKIWTRINPGDMITLKREPHNPYDRKAIALYWQKEKLGYIPMAENTVIANLLDQGARLDACIKKKVQTQNPRERLEFLVRYQAWSGDA